MDFVPPVPRLHARICGPCAHNGAAQEVVSLKKPFGSLVYSPSDLTRFADNPFITWMDRYDLEFPGEFSTDEPNEQNRILFTAGLEYERSVLRRYQREGADVYEVPSDNAFALSFEATRQGRGIIYQARMERDGFEGLADFLVRVERQSRLGSHSYEVWDTKLARSTRPHFVIQLCCYAEMLESLQGHRSEYITVLLGNGSCVRLRTNDYFFYYLSLKKAFLNQQASFDPTAPPEPLGRGHNGRWETVAQEWITREDHLRLVAGISTIQIQRLNAADITTLTGLSESTINRIPKMLDSTFEKLQRQASLQLRSRTLERPAFEPIPITGEDLRKGLALLPPASEMDVVLDLEGFPLIDGGLEYLFGVVFKEENELCFKDWWAHDIAQERCAFESLMDWICERRRIDPQMHVYHYAPYEKTAFRRLMSKYGTREFEMDDLMRHEVFIDLYKVVRQGLRIGTPNYSLKSIESLYRGKRQSEVATARDSIVAYQRWLDAPDGETWEASAILKQIRNYNADDCTSTWELLEWLRSVQSRYSVSSVRPPSPKKADHDPADDITNALARQLIMSIPADRSSDADRWRVRELLAWLLEFHRREARPVWWEMFHRHEMTIEELYDDADCLAELSRTERPPQPFKKSTLFEYRFDPDQDTKIESGSQCYFAHDLEVRTTVETFNGDEGYLEIKLGPTALSKLASGRPPDRLNLIPDEYVSTDTIAESVRRVVVDYANRDSLRSAIEDFLYRRRPRFKDRRQGSVLNPIGDRVAAAIDCVRNLDRTTLCIQGPPGAGKTFTAGHVILDLLKSGKRVGVTANSHKAIANLMVSVLKFAVADGFDFKAAKIGEEDPALATFGNLEFIDAVGNVQPEHRLIGGTAWPFSDETAVAILDYLFVDEAGQVSTANLVGMARSTTNIVLIGDQMQLSQPTAAAHPGESGLSSLNYLLQDRATIPSDIGIFLDTTWRLHPEICHFISETIYEGRLQAEPHTAKRELIQPRDTEYIKKTAGLLFIPAKHEGNTQGSEEEVDVVRDLLAELRTLLYKDHLNPARAIDLNDILVIAPYNMQVRMLKNALGPSARVGTIDQFQGQEAPVVIVSMCSSSADASSRGIDFLLNKNRLNVALSRAQCLAIVVAHPSLVQTHCTSLHHMNLANLFCRIVQEGSTDRVSSDVGVAAGDDAFELPTLNG